MRGTGRAGAALAGIVMWVSVLGACGEHSSPPTTTVHAAPVPAEPTEPEVEPVDAPSRSYTWTIATFRSDQLSECVDFDVTVDVLPDPLPDPWPPAPPTDLIEEAVRLRLPCRESFADRTVLASCVMAAVRPDEGGGTLRPRSYWYDVQVLENDSRMRECLQDGGEWTAVDRESPEAARIRGRSRAQQILDMSRHAGGR